MASSPPTALPVRPLGSQGFKTAAMGLGAMGMSAFYTDARGHGGEEESVAVLRRAVELGMHIDTSDIYGPFTNEELVGRALKGLPRASFAVATKCGIVLRPGGGGMAYDGSPKHIREACEASLKRLGLEHIDLYYLHRVDPNTPVAESFAAMAELVKEGKVCYVGISEASPDDIRAAHAACPLTAVQLEWSIFSRDAERELVPVCRELGIGVVAYSPLGRGMLTGAIKSLDDLPADDWRRNSPRFAPGAFENNLRLVEVVTKVAEAKGATLGQVALAWVHAQGDDVFTIPGTKRLKYLEENAAALTTQRLALTGDELQRLGQAADAVQGDRYADMAATSFHYYKAKGAAAV